MKKHNPAIDLVRYQKIQFNQNLDLLMDFNNSLSWPGSQGLSLASVLYEHENWQASFIGNKNKTIKNKRTSYLSNCLLIIKIAYSILGNLKSSWQQHLSILNLHSVFNTVKARI